MRAMLSCATATATLPRDAPAAPGGAPLLSVRGLTLHIPVPPHTLRTVDGISFALHGGETLGLVGESGSGKTLTPLAVMRLLEPPLSDLPRGEVLLEGRDLMRLVAALLRTVGLPPEAARRYPHEFSGGQRQRIGIARALALEPELVIGDEPVSALDVSIQAQIINLMKRLQAELGLAYIMISHNLAVASHVAGRVAVMYLGRVVETAPREALFFDAQHAYSQALLSAVPEPMPGRRRARQVPQGDVPSLANPPSACHFHPRCPHAMPRCAREVPPSRIVASGDAVACHLVTP